MRSSAQFRHYYLTGPVMEDWVGWAELFTDDAAYFDHYYGTFTGPGEIAPYLEGTMGAAPMVVHRIEVVRHRRRPRRLCNATIARTTPSRVPRRSTSRLHVDFIGVVNTFSAAMPRLERRGITHRFWSHMRRRQDLSAIGRRDSAGQRMNSLSRMVSQYVRRWLNSLRHKVSG